MLVATMHQKEKIIAPLMQKKCGIKCVLPLNFNTDYFGTFSGEIERALPAIETARAKCNKAMELNGADLCIASEGSFGPHPQTPFITVDDEILLLADKKNGLEIFARQLSFETNFARQDVNSYNELVHFAKQAKFPGHAIILKQANAAPGGVVKNINTWKALQAAYNALQLPGKTVTAETDMRAMYNPTRQKVIAQATLKLIEKMKSLCPQCKTPGFAVSVVEPGLPCYLCGCATNGVLAHVYCCGRCGFQQRIAYPYGKKVQDPIYCDNCNP